MTLKTCCRCKELKSPIDFHKNSTKRDGLQTVCKACAILASKHWHIANPEKIKESKRKQYERNPDKYKERTVTYRRNNPDKCKAACTAWRLLNLERERIYGAKWYAENKEHANQVAAAWHIANPNAKRIYKQNRKAQKLLSGGKLSHGLAEKLFKLQRGKCPCCGEPLGSNYHLDHIVPLAKGGLNIDSNIQLLRATCNLQKSTKHPVDFMKERGFLL